MTGCCWQIHDAADSPPESATCWCQECWAGVVTFEFASNIMTGDHFGKVTLHKLPDFVIASGRSLIANR